jgi:hypothetical protein
MKNSEKISRICLSQTPEELMADYCKLGAHFRREAVRAQERGWQDVATIYRELARPQYEAAAKLKLVLRRQELKAACESAADSARALLPSHSRTLFWISVERNAFRAWAYDRGSGDSGQKEDYPTIEQAAACLIERAQLEVHGKADCSARTELACATRLRISCEHRG